MNGKTDLSRFSSADFDKGAGILKMTLWYFMKELHGIRL